MSDFHDVLFPPDISYGSSGGPKFKTSIWDAPSGFDVRVDQWPETRAEYDVSHGIKSEAQAEALTAFFMNRRGRAYSFRFKDFNDYKLENVTLGQGDYATSVYRLQKEYRSTGPNGQEYVTTRLLDKIEAGSDKGVQIDGVTLSKSPSASRYYGIEYTTGKLKLNAPLWGGRFAATAPRQVVSWLPAEPGVLLGDGYISGSVTQSVLYYASVTGHAFVRGFAGPGLGYGTLRRIHLPTATEDARGSHLTMQTPDVDPFDYISAVSPSGMIFLTQSSGNNTCPLVKIDGLTMQYVTPWGVRNIWPADQNGSGVPWAPGCVTINEEYLLHADLWGQITIHHTEDCTPAARLGQFGGITSQQYRAACPYKDRGFAFLLRMPSSYPNRCRLMIWLEGTFWTAIDFGPRTAEPDAVYYDKKTDGLLVFWRGEESNPVNVYYGYDNWCGLFLPEEGRWAWTRRMPPSLQSVLALSNCQTPLDGEFCWLRNTNTPFGRRLWRLHTETGVLESRASGAAGQYQAYDPERKFIGSFGGSILDPAAVISTNLDGVAYTPPEVLTLGSVEYHISVRFDTDHLNMKHEFWTYRSWDSIPLVEARDWSELELD